MQLTELPIVKAKILQRNADGSAVVSVPMAVDTPTLDYSRTGGGGPKDGKLSLSDLQEMEANVASWGKPLSVGFDDAMSGGHARDEGGPHDAWLEAATIQGDTLWGRIKVSAARFSQLLADQWRGFSIELSRNYNDLSKQFEGTVLRGGTFTNNPALRVHFAFTDAPSNTEQRIAAVQFSLGRDEAPRKEIMSDAQIISLTAHEEKLNLVKRDAAIAKEKAESLDTQMISLTEERSRLRAENEQLQSSNRMVTAERDALKAMQTTHDATVATMRKALTVSSEKIVALEAEKLKAERENLDIQVRAIIEEAMNPPDGKNAVPPAYFSGYDDAPADWMLSTYASFDAFKTTVATLRGVSKSLITTPVKSGAEQHRDDSAGKTGLTGEAAAKMAEIEARNPGLAKVDFTGVTNLAEAKARLAAQKGKN